MEWKKIKPGHYQWGDWMVLKADDNHQRYVLVKGLMTPVFVGGLHACTEMAEYIASQTEG